MYKDVLTYLCCVLLCTQLVFAHGGGFEDRKHADQGLQLRGDGCNSTSKIQSGCNDMGGIDCTEKLQDWGGGHCVAQVATNGTTCHDHCRSRGRHCIKAMNNQGTCRLHSAGHESQTTEQDGCLQRWADQICVCNRLNSDSDRDVTLLGPPCEGKSCRSSVSCPLPWMPIRCQTFPEGSVGNGANVEPQTWACTVRGAGPTVRAKVTCSKALQTFSRMRGRHYYWTRSSHPVVVSCPERSKAVSCNCQSTGSTGGPGDFLRNCQGEADFKPSKIGQCARQIPEVPESELKNSRLGGVKVYAICAWEGPDGKTEDTSEGRNPNCTNSSQNYSVSQSMVKSAATSTGKKQGGSQIEKGGKIIHKPVRSLGGPCTYCSSTASCPEGLWPIQCSALQQGDHRAGRGAYINAVDNTCVAMGSLSSAPSIRASLLCSDAVKTFSVDSNDQYLSGQTVSAACPGGTRAISCNCRSDGTLKACRGRSEFKPFGYYCSVDVPKGSSDGVKVSAICAELADLPQAVVASITSGSVPSASASDDWNSASGQAGHPNRSAKAYTAGYDHSSSSSTLEGNSTKKSLALCLVIILLAISLATTSCWIFRLRRHLKTMKSQPSTSTAEVIGIPISETDASSVGGAVITGKPVDPANKSDKLDV
eukprot:TRINITY_DN16895_c2_g1_i1.p1 TRINITY_DN16895_c2_g1~~TRINITY_DN16895_c2_g1_i1.p1  ORF type:complete len:648 (-),score=79.45 TRINITY_DN16895_c2_g1_i1:169-2112(-)